MHDGNRLAPLEDQWWAAVKNRATNEKEALPAFENLAELDRGPWGLGSLKATAHAAVIAAARRKLGSKNVDAIDHERLANDLLLVLYMKANMVNGSLRGWMYGVAKKLVLREMRGEKLLTINLDSKILESVASIEPDDADEDRPETLGQEKELLRVKIEELPDKLREVARRHFIDRCSSEEICKELRIKPPTMRKRLERARAALAELLKAAGPQTEI
jgi:RNA polymerase sigma factor (sigma-70 family)